MKLFTKKLLQVVLAFAMIITAIGMNQQTAYAAYETSTKNADGLYTVTLTYDPSTYTGEDEVTSVGFLGSFVFYPSNLTGHTDETGMMDNTVTYTPADYETGMALLGGSYFENMVYDEASKLYKLEIQLPGGAYIYNFVINPVLGDVNTEDATKNVLTSDGTFSIVSGTTLMDPEYKPLYETPKPEQVVPTFYVGSGQEVSWNPIEDESKRGDISFVPYTDVNGDTQNIGVYLPAGYDADAEKPYKVIFASHGYGGDETHWVTLLGINNVMDNLIAEGKTEEAIVITMNNTAYNWEFPTIMDNVLNYIIPFVEANYNVSTDSADRAFCGLSMGSMTTLYMYMNATTSFDYYGAFSGGYNDENGFDLAKKELADVTLLIGCGEEDFAYANEFIGVPQFIKKLDSAGLEYTSYYVTGAHDMFTWPQMYAYFVENTVWSKTSVSEQPALDAGTAQDTDATQADSVPQTGESFGVLLIAGLAGFAFAGVVLLANRKKLIKQAR